MGSRWADKSWFNVFVRLGQIQLQQLFSGFRHFNHIIFPGQWGQCSLFICCYSKRTLLCQRFQLTLTDLSQKGLTPTSTSPRILFYLTTETIGKTWTFNWKDLKMTCWGFEFCLLLSQDFGSIRMSDRMLQQLDDFKKLEKTLVLIKTLRHMLVLTLSVQMLLQL